ncbi:unnamed protein product [Paramecium primaurelia]|uniref:RRM domain-containing protein n=1 Tax=Paramecium primaurelia TaxID=5886 RepID=A0A8S1KIX4_PARPR|nr:unnamed protein product [Paramecium primaurelia]
MKKNQIFSKSINIIRDRQQEYKPSQHSASKSKQESDEENGKMYSSQIMKKDIRKQVIKIQNHGHQQYQANVQVHQQQPKKNGILNISRKDQQQQHQQQPKSTGSFPIFIRNIREGSTQNELKQLINDDSNILGIQINNKQATITFSNQQSADQAIELINNYKEKGYQMSAVPNYQQSSKVIVLGQFQSGRGSKDDGRLRMDVKESIFDRIQTKQS